jgi:outer membrane protein OmpA-like peptidoglycan-associated protein
MPKFANVQDVKIQQNQNSTIYTLPADILFDFDKADLQADAEVALQQISSSIAQRFANAPIQINGHTDSVGNNAYNRELSKRRAESVRQWLITKTNIQPDQMTIQGRGKSQPVAPNTKPDGSDNPQGRQQNRRVEIIVRASSS